MGIESSTNKNNMSSKAEQNDSTIQIPRTEPSEYIKQKPEMTQAAKCTKISLACTR
jgi:hypothetical protein